MVRTRMKLGRWRWLRKPIEALLTGARSAFARLRCRQRRSSLPPPDSIEKARDPLVEYEASDVAIFTRSPGAPPPELTSGRGAEALQALARRGVIVTARLAEHRHATPRPEAEHLLHLRSRAGGEPPS